MEQQQTFRAVRFEDALSMVRRALGPDALIVGHRQLGSDLALDGQRVVEVTAMSAAAAQAQGTSPTSAGYPELFERRLVRSGVRHAAAQTLARRVAECLATRPREAGGREPEALAYALESEVTFAPPIGHRTRVAALVGPTGVGKTTTVAKLAARAALLEQRRVGLVSLDYYRVGGVEQLRRYAELTGVHMEVASDGASLELALERLARADLVLIDTAGRSPRDIDAHQQLAACLRAAQEPVETYLCVPAATRPMELSRLANQLSVLEPTRLISTKVDEAIGCEGLIALHCTTGLPFAYLTTGQRVPEDIERATPQLVAALLSGEETQPS